ncbi:Gypsy retrotransposon integrase-like protein 1 [Elysia marginata]|uniref:Gypsy retrotransposon integrase-like protein 1 n=1 Tax=Elysia marginata TaxID=1093978 RepID=A0AAV4IP94_9GAST|nr:Gypsy retrotransposon integrase-like protein 1 [Elysia marginata]
MAAKKTTDRILQDFYWPNVWNDVTQFCRSCDQCQRSAPRGLTSKVSLLKVPFIDEPFSGIAVDIVGPILPALEKGNKYIFTVADFCTRYPKAVTLRNIDTITVAEALADVFTRTGIPTEILSDRGTNCTSELMAEICRLLSMKRLTTSPYHPQCNGLVERFSGTLKRMLKKLAAARPRDWKRYINAALLAFREAPLDSLGFTPFELVFRRPASGPMAILRELWTEEIRDEEVKITYEYVVDLSEKLESMIELAHENLRTLSIRHKYHFDKKAK